MSPQSSIAHYRITAKLGEGGMGEVWRATDTKLNRDVAIKVLPKAFAQDASRMARFQNEARVLASLNHPNIAAIYGVEEGALVLEFVTGPTLAERIAQGPLPLDEALGLARQMIEALDYAHEKGIVHRDLKPANIKISDDRLKVLDFGLAKAVANDALPSNQADSPTLTMYSSAAGTILGTAPYMSPEQARGQRVDKRVLNLMDDCSWLNQTMLQWIAKSDTAWPVDRELGDFHDSFGGQKWLTYQRYDLRFQSKWLKDNLGLDIADRDLVGLDAMDKPRNLTQLEELGVTAATDQIRPEHFPRAFDIESAVIALGDSRLAAVVPPRGWVMSAKHF